MALSMNIDDFDEYTRQGEPDKIEKAYIWQTAIALLLVDGNRYSHIRATEEWKRQPLLDELASTEQVQGKLGTSPGYWANWWLTTIQRYEG